MAKIIKTVEIETNTKAAAQGLDLLNDAIEQLDVSSKKLNKTNMKNEAKTTETTLIEGIVKRIVTKLKLGDDGKILSFFERLRKNIHRNTAAGDVSWYRKRTMSKHRSWQNLDDPPLTNSC